MLFDCLRARGVCRASEASNSNAAVSTVDALAPAPPLILDYPVDCEGVASSIQQERLGLRETVHRLYRGLHHAATRQFHLAFRIKFGRADSQLCPPRIRECMIRWQRCCFYWNPFSLSDLKDQANVPARLVCRAPTSVQYPPYSLSQRFPGFNVKSMCLCALLLPQAQHIPCRILNSTLLYVPRLYVVVGVPRFI